MIRNSPINKIGTAGKSLLGRYYMSASNKTEITLKGPKRYNHCHNLTTMIEKCNLVSKTTITL